MVKGAYNDKVVNYKDENDINKSILKKEETDMKYKAKRKMRNIKDEK